MANPTIVLTGRVGKEPESVGSNGLRFRIATSDRVKNEQTGEWEDKNTSWWTVKAWRGLADQSKNTVKKGMEVTVIGKIYEENWVDRDGEKRTSVEINADAISVTTFTLSKDLKSSSPEDVFPSYKNLSDVPF
jgi:single-strand DNA-binding protein